MRMNLVTQNPNKVKEFRLILEPEIEVKQIKVDYPELRSDDNVEIVKLAAKMLCEKFGKAIVVEDSGLFIDALRGFPGTVTAYTAKRIGNKGILKLMKGIENRKCQYKSAIGYCEPDKDPVAFEGAEEGTIAEEERGEQGWGEDPMFIPKGETKTYGELRKEGDINLFRKRALEKFREYLIKNQ